MIEVLQWLVALALLAVGVMASVHIGKSAHGETAVSVRSGVAVTMGLVFLAYVFLVTPAVGQVPAGHRGVVLQFGAVTGTVLGEGLYFVTPVVNTVEEMDVQTQAYSTDASAASNDLQTVTTKITLNYWLDPGRVASVYQNLRRDYGPRIITPAVQEAVKANTALYQAEELITKRPTIKHGIEQTLRERLAVHGILVDTVNMTDFKFSDEFEDAIEKKVVAEQRVLTATNDLERIKVEAKQRVEQATAEATAIRIRAEALKENAQLVQLEAVQKWDGKLPQIVLGDAIPFISLGDITKGQTQR